MTKKIWTAQLILASIVSTLLISCSNNRNNLTSTTYETKTEAKEACNKWKSKDGRVILIPDIKEEKEIEGSRWTTLDELLENGDIKNVGQTHTMARVEFNRRSNEYVLGKAVNGKCVEEDDQYLGYRRTGGITEEKTDGSIEAPSTYLDLIKKRRRIGEITDKEGNTTAWIREGGKKLSKRFRYR